jgi:hypothetical protein
MRTLFMTIGLVALPACVDSDSPEVTLSTQAMRVQPGETIEIHGCPPGQVERGGGMCYNPILNLPPEESTSHGIGYEGGGGGGDGNYGHGGLLSYHEYAPGVTVYQFAAGFTDTLKAIICESVCISLSVAICDAIKAACAVGSVVTLGGVTIPCVALGPAVCLGGVVAGTACTKLMCPKGD